jgi:hypothetical protein
MECRATAVGERQVAAAVARAAQVSIATVSKVLNEQPRVSDATRRRVNETMVRLGYRPNEVARSLRNQRSRTLALISDDIEGVFAAGMMHGVEEVATLGVRGALCNSYGEPERERAHLQRLWDQRVQGVILMSSHRVQRRGPLALPLPGVPARVPLPVRHRRHGPQHPARRPRRRRAGRRAPDRAGSAADRLHQRTVELRGDARAPGRLPRCGAASETGTRSASSSKPTTGSPRTPSRSPAN